MKQNMLTGRATRALMVVLGLVMGSGLVSGAGFYMKIAGIEGECQVVGHEGEVEVRSWSFGVSNEVSRTGSGGGAGKVQMGDLMFTKELDKSSPKLMLSTANGVSRSEVVLVCKEDSSDRSMEYLKITLNDVIISSYSVSGRSSGDRPTEEVSLNFARIHVEYTTPGADGTAGEKVEMSWDLEGNVGE